MSKQTSQKGAEFNDSATHIPCNAGISVVAGKYSSYLLRIYITLAVFALASFILDWDPRVQCVGLAVLFPGGGLVGIGGWWILAFVFNLTNFNVIDQFQTASIRYQLCEIVYVLALANKLYTPSFRSGYLQQAQKKSTDYEPVKKDNVMLTAFLLLATGLYESATGDRTFSQDNALELIIDDNHCYRHSARTLAQALMRNFSISSYCLYPCEDEIGSTHPIRSYPAGLRLPNIVGAANEFSISCLAGVNFPDLSLRCYAIARHEYMEFDSQCRVSYKNIQNGDRLDPGNYGTSMALVFSSSLMAAHEHGDEEVARQITTLIDNDQTLRRIEKDGVVWDEGVSLFMKCRLLHSRRWLRSGWSRFMQPLSDAVQRGPYLVDVNYAEVSQSPS
ncbi:hypothetical protein HG530_014638 [Fusarium avenaceum]|nr:hypothetical protein HG530_014638 [Fusarium avenaceum]